MKFKDLKVGMKVKAKNVDDWYSNYDSRLGKIVAVDKYDKSIHVIFENDENVRGGWWFFSSVKNTDDFESLNNNLDIDMVSHMLNDAYKDTK